MYSQSKYKLVSREYQNELNNQATQNKYVKYWSSDKSGS